MSYLDEHEDVRVRVFDCFGFTNSRSESALTGEIYELPKLESFDGVVVQSHQILSDSALARLGERICRTKIPAVSIGDYMDGCIQINTDDYRAFREITEHLISVHGAESFLFLKGKERAGSSEALRRQRGFEDVCRVHGIPGEQITYAGGSWQSAEGRKAVEAMIESGGPLPDAIVSANDEMALGAMSALKKAGIRVPEDILVTGYDDTFGASLSTPRLATVRRDFKTLVYMAMEMLQRRIDGETQLPELVFSPYRTVFAGSCGCGCDTDYELAVLKTRYYEHNRKLTHFYAQQDRMTSELFFAQGPGELLDVMEDNAQIFGDGEMFICENDLYHRNLTQGDEDAALEREAAGRYGNRFWVSACSARPAPCDRHHVYGRFERTQLLETPFWRDEKFLIFYPLHFEKILMGFCVLTKPPTASDMNIHEVVMNLFEFAMENARQRLIARQLNQRLDELYMTDPLTGLYNRYGYERMAEDIFFRLRRQGARVHVLFLDIDDMKGINDRHGHENGDLAIKTVARVMKSSCRRNDFKMRYGGDEFVIITEESDADLKGRLKAGFDRLNASGDLPFPLKVSIGQYVGTVSAETIPDEFLDRADRSMYEEKAARKASAAG